MKTGFLVFIIIVALSLLCTFASMPITGTPMTQEAMRHTFSGWMILYSIVAISLSILVITIEWERLY